MYKEHVIPCLTNSEGPLLHFSIKNTYTFIPWPKVDF